MALASARMCHLNVRRLIIVATALSLAACGGGGGGNENGSESPPSRHTVGGTVSGLAGAVTLQNNGGDTITISANGAFRFGALVVAGQNYRVSVTSQPVNQHCAVAAGSGVMGSSDISNVAITCTTTRFSVGGTVSGLNGTAVLRNNGGDDLTLTANGQFSFAATLAPAAAYEVTVLSQPADQQCTVTSGTGTMNTSAVTGVTVTCTSTRRVGGTISGLAGTLTLQNNGTDDLITATNGSFTLPTPVLEGTGYQVTIGSQPSSSRCTVASGSGIMGSTDVTNIVVSCAPTFTVGGTISGLVGPVVLTNGTDQLTVNNDGAFTFGAPLLSGDSYAVSLLSASDPSQQCEVSSGIGTITAANVTNVTVTCIGKAARYRAESYASFTSVNGVDNLEGTWILLADGTQSQGALVAGINPRRDYDLWSRTTVRIRRDPLDPAYYFVLTCGPGGARNTRTTPSADSFYVPYYAYATNEYISYGVTIVDATTMSRASVFRRYGFTASSAGMGWDFSWVLKRISDDPFASTSTLRDNLSSQTLAATCFHEVEGTYAATEHDGTSETSRIEGYFYWTDAYESRPSQLLNDIDGYAPRFSVKEEIGFRTWYGVPLGFQMYRSEDGDQISTLRSFSGLASSHSAQAMSADGLRNADDSLEISP